MSRRFTRLEGFVRPETVTELAAVPADAVPFRFEPLFDEVDLLLKHSGEGQGQFSGAGESLDGQPFAFVSRQVSDIASQQSGIRQQEADIAQQVSGIAQQGSGIAQQVSGIAQQESDLSDPERHIASLASSIDENWQTIATECTTTAELSPSDSEQCSAAIEVPSSAATACDAERAFRWTVADESGAATNSGNATQLKRKPWLRFRRVR